MPQSRVRRALAVAAVAASASLALGGCSVFDQLLPQGEPAAAPSLVVGTVDSAVSLDPAGAYDPGSFLVMNQVYPFLLNSKPGSADVEPDLASGAGFTSATDYTVTLKPGLKFANGDALTSSDVKFSFDRQLKIASPTGPSALLGNLDSVDATDPQTVVFHLKQGGDQTFPQVLASSAGPIVDEQVFSPTDVTPDASIVAGKPFAGPYTITTYHPGAEVDFAANLDYQGVLGMAATEGVALKYFPDSKSVRAALDDGSIDVAYRGLAPSDIADLTSAGADQIVTGPGGEVQFLVFDYAAMPFGTASATPSTKKALAVRQAVADLVDRMQLAQQAYQGLASPLYSFVPSGVAGSGTPLQKLYGDKKGGPSTKAATTVLAKAKVALPVPLTIVYNTDHYGEASGNAIALIKTQLESSGLFTVTAQAQPWTAYAAQRTTGAFPVYQFSWTPDYPDPDDYLSPLFGAHGVLGNGYADSTLQGLIAKQLVDQDPDDRATTVGLAQARLAAALPTLPLLQGSQTVVARPGVIGVTVDGSFKFRFGTMSK